MTAREEEIEATMFALCLLMPEHLLREWMSDHPGFNLLDDSAVERLAREFKVSVPMMGFRLGQIFGEFK